MQIIKSLDKKTLDKGIEEVKEKGYTIFEGVLTDEQADYYRDLCNHVYDQHAQYYREGQTHKKFHGESKVKMLYNLHNKHEDFLPILFNDNLSYMNDVLLREGSYKDSEPYQLHISTARGITGPADAQQLHIDSNLPGTGYVLMMQMFWALNEMTNENGGTCVIPGSHKRRTFAEDGKRYDDEVIVNCPKGSLFAVDAAVWHGSSEKVTQDDRWVMVNGYSRWWMRPTFEQSCNTPPHIHDLLTDEQKELLGFKYRMPLDEFTRTARINPEFEWDENYALPGDQLRRSA